MRKVPKLRFKEFSDEWEKLNAEEIFENISNKKHNGDLPILAVTQDKGVVYRDSLDLKINSSEEGIKNYKIIEPGNFIISLRSFQGGIEYSDILGIGSPAYTILKSKKNIEDIFYKFYLKKSSFISELNKTIEGIRDGKQISYSMFSKLKLPYPAIKEQEKIANFLSSIDKKISLTEKKLELFKEYKKGVMQKIFSQELRFKDNEGNDYPEWEEKRLGDVLESIVDNRGKTPPNNDNNKLIPLIEVNAIGERNIKYGNVTKFVDEETYINWFRNYIQKDDILFSTVGATALCSIYKANIKSVIAQNLVGLRAKKEIISDYLYYVLIDKKNNLKFKSIEMIAVQPSIKVSQMVDLKFKISISLEEQQKIADFLSSIDTKIENIEKELENLKEFKKGLLQQMFV